MRTLKRIGQETAPSEGRDVASYVSRMFRLGRLAVRRIRPIFKLLFGSCSRST
jgi:hypothetical protein